VWASVLLAREYGSVYKRSSFSTIEGSDRDFLPGRLRSRRSEHATGDSHSIRKVEGTGWCYRPKDGVGEAIQMPFMAGTRIMGRHGSTTLSPSGRRGLEATHWLVELPSRRLKLGQLGRSVIDGKVSKISLGAAGSASRTQMEYRGS
jgi:hypothetical protein